MSDTSFFFSSRHPQIIAGRRRLQARHIKSRWEALLSLRTHCEQLLQRFVRSLPPASLDRLAAPTVNAAEFSLCPRSIPSLRLLLCAHLPLLQPHLHLLRKGHHLVQGEKEVLGPARLSFASRRLPATQLEGEVPARICRWVPELPGGRALPGLDADRGTGDVQEAVGEERCGRAEGWEVEDRGVYE